MALKEIDLYDEKQCRNHQKFNDIIIHACIRTVSGNLA